MSVVIYGSEGKVRILKYGQDLNRYTGYDRVTFFRKNRWIRFDVVVSGNAGIVTNRYFSAPETVIHGIIDEYSEKPVITGMGSAGCCPGILHAKSSNE